MEGIAPGINMRRLVVVRKLSVEKCSPQTTELSVKHSTSVEMGVLLKKNHRDCTTSMID
jgi:hypothetical protein